MKKLILSLTMVFLTCCAHPNSTITKSYNYNENEFLAALKSDNNGLVESTIFQLVYHHLWGVEMCSKEILSELESLKHYGNSENIRKISGIAVKFYKEFDSELKAAIKGNFLNQEKLFIVISDVLKNKNMDSEDNYVVKE